MRLLSYRIPVLWILPLVLIAVFLLHTYQGIRFAEAVSRTCGNGVAQAGDVSTSAAQAHGNDVRCRAFPDPGNLQVIIKTGATEAYQKLLPQLTTSMACSQRVEVFSDLEEMIGPYHVRDALLNLDAEVKETHPDLEVYRLQQEYQATGQDIEELAKKHKVVWNLDKYKFTHIVQETWKLHPGLDWYLFIEADTYVFWGNLNLWLRQLNPSKKLYMGSEAVIATQSFAHGGSGFVISGPLMKRFAGDDPFMAARNDKILSELCCGDHNLGRAITKYTGTQMQNHWPWFNGETPWSIPYKPDLWCMPVITFHHISPRQRSILWHFEQNRKNVEEPLLFQEVSELAFPSGKIPELIEDWDNLSDAPVDNPGGAPHTLETCKRACNFRDNCWQYMFSDGECLIRVNGFSFGAKKPPAAGKRWISGWKPDMIERFRKEHVCNEPEWRGDDYAVRNSIF